MVMMPGLAERQRQEAQQLLYVRTAFPTGSAAPPAVPLRQSCLPPPVVCKCVYMYVYVCIGTSVCVLACVLCCMSTCVYVRCMCVCVCLCAAPVACTCMNVYPYGMCVMCADMPTCAGRYPVLGELTLPTQQILHLSSNPTLRAETREKKRSRYVSKPTVLPCPAYAAYPVCPNDALT